MSATWFDSTWDWIGWIGISCFFTRFLIQWIASERAGEPVTPQIFWWISLAGAILMIGYSLERGDPIFLAGYLVTLAIYIRNLWIFYRPQGALGPMAVSLMATAAWALLVILGLVTWRPADNEAVVWLGIGGTGQALWSSRFVVQWMLSERKAQSHLPEAFWWISLIGNSLLLLYALHLGDPVWIAGLALGPFVQIRNLMIIYRARA